MEVMLAIWKEFCRWRRKKREGNKREGKENKTEIRRKQGDLEIKLKR